MIMNRKFLLPFVAALTICLGCGDGGTQNDLGEPDAIAQDLAGDLSVQDAVVGDPGQDMAVADMSDQDISVQDVPADMVPSDLVQDVPGDIIDPVNIGQNPLTSECGGFVDLARAAQPADETNCGDDKLQWSVDEENGVVHFTNFDVFLNCCGVHDVTVHVDNGVFVITEIDEPEEGGGRCNCMCLFDFSVDMPIPEATTVQVRIFRHSTDEGDGVTAWEGEIDLTPGSGEVMIKEKVGWCFESVNIGVNVKASDCGGFGPVPASPAAPADGTDCIDETLNWVFDAGTGTVSFTNQDIYLNCCGVHTMEIFLDDDVYVLQETDSPGDGRCKCMCQFDYAIDLPDMAPGIINVRLLRDITDSDTSPVYAWEGSIDLTQGSGQIVVLENSYCL
jgi:hypothetical protein